MRTNPLWVKVTSCFSDTDPINVLKLASEVYENDSEKFVKSQILNDNINKLRNIVNRTFSIEYVPNEANIDEAIDIFDRVNSKGTKLSDADLALTHIVGKWPKARRIFKKKIEVLKERNFHFDLRFIVRYLSGIIKGRALYETLHNTTKEELIEGWNKLKRILDYIINIFPKHAYIHSTEDITTNIVLVPFIVHLSKKENCEFKNLQSMKRAIRWLYLAHLWRRYFGEINQKLDHDINIVMRNEDPWEELIDVITEQRGRITLEAAFLEGRTTEHPIFKMLYILIKSKGAIDWLNGSSLYNTYGESFKIHKHHIFPVSLLYDDKYDSNNHLHRKIVNEIANRVFLTARSNISEISNREPKTYLPEIIRNFGSKALEDQLIPLNQELWDINRYEDFLAKRRKLIAKEINKFIESFKEIGEERKEKPTLSNYLKSGESSILEFKSSVRWDYYQERVNKDLEQVIVKTIAAFMNTEGGTLLIGVNDDGEIIGIEKDINTLRKKNNDGFELLLNNLISEYMGAISTHFRKKKK